LDLNLRELRAFCGNNSDQMKNAIISDSLLMDTAFRYYLLHFHAVHI